jgi:signal transduction histidine kinase/ActR/RegA family two-component response regulator
MNKEKEKLKRYFPLHLKLLGIILLFLIFLTMTFSISAYVTAKNHLMDELELKKNILYVQIIEPYKKKSNSDFINYINTEHFIKLLEFIDVMSFLILDSNDKVFYSNYPEDISAKIINDVTDENKKRYLKEKGYDANLTSALYQQQQSYDYQIYISENHEYKGTFYASLSLEKFHKSMAKVLLSTIIIFLIVLFISIIIFLYASKAITKPIRLLKNAAEKVANGDFNNAVDFTSDDEIGLLASSFNDMTAKLKEFHVMRVDQIKRLNEELTQKNTELEGSYEETEATNEELETTNEELIATNEELEIANRDLFAMAQDLKKSKEELEGNMIVVNSANEELRVLNKMKTSFLGMASHELKTPLVMIKGYAELILDTKSESMEGSIKEMVSHILKGADTLNSIIHDMLDITKIEAKELKLHIVPVELKLILDTIALEMKEVANKRKQVLSVGDFPKVNILADAPQVHRVLIHLVSNAIKFTPDHGKITVSADIVKDNVLTSIYKEDSDLDFIDITIEDTGIGIDKAEQNRIFDVFYEVGDIDHHRTSKSAYLGKGSGLGLTICKGIVEAHRGRIWVESEEVNLKTFPGSKFHVVLPLKSKKVKALEEKPILKKEAKIKVEKPIDEKQKELPKKKPKVLLIEDEQDIIMLTTLILKDKYTLEICDNGADGIKKAFEFKPNVILLDIYMKGLNGYEVCTILKANEKTKNIPIAMFTAGTQKYEMERGYKAGVDDYITKPFNPKDLTERIDKLVSGKE